jgi:hypothetical protein
MILILRRVAQKVLLGLHWVLTIAGSKKEAPQVVLGEILSDRIDLKHLEGIPELNALVQSGWTSGQGFSRPFDEALRDGDALGNVPDCDGEGVGGFCCCCWCGDWGAARGGQEEEDGGEGLSQGCHVCLFVWSIWIDGVDDLPF